MTAASRVGAMFQVRSKSGIGFAGPEGSRESLGGEEAGVSSTHSQNLGRSADVFPAARRRGAPVASHTHRTLINSQCVGPVGDELGRSELWRGFGVTYDATSSPPPSGRPYC